MNTKEKLIEKVGAKLVEDNPFISSDEFMHLIKGIANIPKILLIATKGPGEFMNAMHSVIVTMLRNIPDKVWEELHKQVSEKSDADKQTTFAYLTALRNKVGVEKSVELTSEDVDDDMPALTAAAPKMAS